MTVARLIERHRRRGYSLLGVTDHPDDLTNSEYRRRARICSDGCDSEFACLYGLEGATSSGPHLIGVGLREYVPFHKLAFGRAVEEVRAQGGVAILAHPELDDLRRIGEAGQMLHGVEVWNGIKDGWGPNVALMRAIRSDPRRWPKPMYFGGPDAHRPGQMFNIETIVATSGPSVRDVLHNLIGGHFLLRRGLLFLHAVEGEPTVAMQLRRSAYRTLFGLMRRVRHRAIGSHRRLPDQLIKHVESLLT